MLGYIELHRKVSHEAALFIGQFTAGCINCFLYMYTFQFGLRSDPKLRQQGGQKSKPLYRINDKSY